ncbi:MAG: N-acetylmuramic acid 6-phosphate etherase [Clostridia bacterium]|nr:N-acetylmuramic acid 6-phosphate etherase [Clostridia bacterium]
MLETEKRNPNTKHIDRAATAEMLKMIQAENLNAVNAVGEALESVEAAIEAAVDSLNRGGRLFYIGAGTSGRLGVLDASECPPTFGVSGDLVVGIIAGGDKSLRTASEFAEDNAEAGRQALVDHGLTENDTVVGISASGGAAYVVGALEYANSVGAVSVSVSSNRDTPMERIAKIAIVTETGPEVITGSTRMKSGTAQKLVLNMISTCAMIKTGRVYENLMINLRPTNIKLKARMVSIVSDILECDRAEAEARLERNEWNIRKAVAETESAQ